jgi:hypothetical protein
MIQGLSGHLVSEFFLEHYLGERSSSDHLPAGLIADLKAWHHSTRGLGPASPVRAILEAGGMPVFELLGYTKAGAPSPVRHGLATTLNAGGERVVLIASGWDEPLDPLWRSGVEHASRTGAAWCFLFNGTSLRLIEAQRLYSRRHVGFDIALALDNRMTLAALDAVMSARALSVLHELIAASDRHSTGVCRSLRAGVREASAEFRHALLERSRRGGELASEQALTIVYRILFLLFAEARHLVPLWHPIYRGSYSLQTLCDTAERSGAATGLWDAIKAVSRLAHSGCRIGDLTVTAFNGRLFSPSRTPLVERHDLDDRAAKRALVALSTRPAVDRQGRERISYRDLGVEELGGVYESLLDDQPRKASGTFYTPRGIAQYLVRRTLAPLVAGATPERILELAVLDPAMGSGAFLVASCFYLAQAYEAAMLEHGGCRPGDFGPAERAAIRRTIAERCLYGVDLNPMAVQLARLSLWLATLSADRPLSFLDHHLVSGDSLLGAWLSSLPRGWHTTRQKPLGLPLIDAATVADAMRSTVPARFSLARTPNDTADQVRDKERQLTALNARDGLPAKWKRVADLWCAAWFARPCERPPASAFGALSDAVLGGARTLPDSVSKRFLEAAEGAASRKSFFHWELEFPEVFFSTDGSPRPRAGFDAVLGNPPWDMIRGDSGATDARGAQREHANAVLRFTRDSGTYTSQSGGHANRYQLFVERAVALTRRGGRIGLVLPSGIAADHGSAALRRHLFSRCAVDAIVGFENRARIFPIHRSVRFHLVTASAGAATGEFGCRLGERDARVLEHDPGGPRDAWFPVTLTPALLERLGGGDVAIPDFRAAVDVTIAEKAAALFAPLSDPRAWNARFGRELNATDDRRHFRSGGAGFPVFEGKALEPFRANTKATSYRITERDATKRLGDRCLRRRLAYRDVASATNRVTLIAALLPARSASTHTVFCLRTPLAARAQHFLCGLFNSFVVNYLVRLRVTTHVTTAIVERLPIPCESDCGELFDAIAAAARLLARAPNPDVCARMNARVAEIYQLSHAEFAHVLDTFPLVPREERDRALAAMNQFA